MTVTSNPWGAPARTRHVSLVRVPRAVLEQLAEGDLKEAARLSGLTLTEYQIGDECRGVWQMRLKQLRNDPGSGPWVTRFVVESGTRRVVGRAGFHGPPDERGMVEVGYAIEPPHRRQGYARSALRILLGVAASHPKVSVVRAAVSPENHASQALIRQFGFLRVGEQWDELDGPEAVFEVPAARGT